MKPKLGPDHTFIPNARPDDLGGLYAGFAVLKEMRLCAMNFGTPVTWVASKKAKALRFVAMVREEIYRNFGRLSYDKSTLPIRVVAVPERQVIESHMPQTLEILAANPEAFLAWAERIEEEAEKLSDG